MNLENPLETHTDLISEVISRCEVSEFLYLAGVSKAWKSAWEASSGRPKNTSVHSAASTPQRTEWVLHDAEFWTAAKQCGVNVLEIAARAGNLTGLRSAARQLGDKWSLPDNARRVTNAAAEGGSIDTLQWALTQGCPWDSGTCASAAAGGQLQTLIWLKERGCPWDETSCSLAASNGHLQVLQWARKQGCPWNQQACSLAAAGGHLEVLQWAREQGCPSGLYTCTYAAAEGGQLGVLRWARGEGYAWDRFVCHFAARTGHLEMLKWAAEHACPFDRQTCATVAEENGHQEIQKWIYQQEPGS